MSGGGGGKKKRKSIRQFLMVVSVPEESVPANFLAIPRDGKRKKIE